MAISTYKVFLMYKASDGGSYEKLIDIKSFGDLGGTPETIETTTLSDNMQTSILGIQSLDALEFDCNYDKTEFAKLKALEGSQHDFAVWFGGTTNQDNTVTPTGGEGKFSFKGELSVYPAGGGVNEVVNMKVSISPSTVIAFTAE